MNKKILGLVSSIILILLLLAGCTGKNHGKQITIVGSTALQPLVEQAASDYQKNASDISITVQGGGSGTGLSQVQSGAVAIGNSDIFAEQADGIKASELTDYQVAVVGIVPIVNPKLGINNLTTDQLRQIFTGQITNWKQVSGPNEKIIVINRAQGSGTRKTFEDTVLNGKEAVKSQEQDSNGTVQQIVRSTKGAISYVSFSYVSNQVRAVKLDGVKPTAANVATNKWKIWSYEHMYTKKNTSQTVKDFLAYMQSMKVQKSLVKNLGYISIHEMQVTKDKNNQVTQK